MQSGYTAIYLSISIAGVSNKEEEEENYSWIGG
jgi:hypothetical protein